MDFEIPEEIRLKLAELDRFIEDEIAPLETENLQFFDHGRVAGILFGKRAER